MIKVKNKASKFYLMPFFLAFIISCKSDDKVFTEHNFVETTDLSYGTKPVLDGRKSSLIIHNNPFYLNSQDSLILLFNQYAILRASFSEVNEILIPYDLFDKNIQTNLIIKRNNLKAYSFIKKDFAFNLSHDTVINSQINLVFSPSSFREHPYVIFAGKVY